MYSLVCFSTGVTTIYDYARLFYAVLTSINLEYTVQYKRLCIFVKPSQVGVKAIFI